MSWALSWALFMYFIFIEYILDTVLGAGSKY